MTRMLDLRDVLELIDDGLNDRSAAQQNAIAPGHQLVLHILAQLGNQLKIKHLAQRLSKGLRDVTLVSEELAKQLLGQTWHGFPVIHIAGCDAKLQDFTAVIDDQVQFEAKEPAQPGFATGSQPSKHLVIQWKPHGPSRLLSVQSSLYTDFVYFQGPLLSVLKQTNIYDIIQISHGFIDNFSTCNIKLLCDKKKTCLSKPIFKPRYIISTSRLNFIARICWSS